jgi:hypothetical protein
LPVGRDGLLRLYLLDLANQTLGYREAGAMAPNRGRPIRASTA